MAKIHPSNLLLLTVVKKPDGEGHAILTVRTDHGDILLDNLERPMTVDKSRYKILKTVDPLHENQWVSVQGRVRPSMEAQRTAATHSVTPDL